MKEEWNPVFSIETQERGMVIKFDLRGWHHLGVRLTSDGSLLHVHRSPLDGPHEEVILECPPDYDADAATGEAKAGSFQILLPLRQESVRKGVKEERFRKQVARHFPNLPQHLKQADGGKGNFSEN